MFAEFKHMETDLPSCVNVMRIVRYYAVETVGPIGAPKHKSTVLVLDTGENVQVNNPIGYVKESIDRVVRLMNGVF